MSSSDAPKPLGQVLVDFAERRAYPEDEGTSAARVDDSALPAALGVLRIAKQELESEIKKISRGSATDVDAWISNATGIDKDVQESKKLSSNIARLATENKKRIETLMEQEKYAHFLEKELSYQVQLLGEMSAIQRVYLLFNKAEEYANVGRITEALPRLETAEEALAEISIDKTTKVMRLMHANRLDLRARIHDRFIDAWDLLVTCDPGKPSVTIYKELPGTSSNLQGIFKGLQKFDEINGVARKLWMSLDHLIVGRRISVEIGDTPMVVVNDNEISLVGSTDRTIKSLFRDIQILIQYLHDSLPQEFISVLAGLIMPQLSNAIIQTWLDASIPASFDVLLDYQKALAIVEEFARKLDEINWPGSQSFHDWVSNAPRLWLNKRRETELDWVRNQISLGTGLSKMVERVEKPIVAQEEAKDIKDIAEAIKKPASTWDSAWDSDDDTASNLSSSPEKNVKDPKPQNKPAPKIQDDVADSWAWGDEETEEITDPQPASKKQPSPEIPPSPKTPVTRQVTITEKYWISSMPQPILIAVKNVYDDAARLTRPENESNPVSPAAPGLFVLPSLMLAMYRAVSPNYYSMAPGGNMFLYSDAMWLAEKLTDFRDEWKTRKDVTPRAYGMIRLDPEISSMTSFGKRAYTNELVEQRTIIGDLFGGTSNFFQQDGKSGKDALNQDIDIIIQHIRDQNKIWSKILAKSALASATGSLVNTVATRLINDIFELSSISVDEAERIATVISRVEKLDDMFLKPQPPKKPRKKGQPVEPEEEPVPITASFADKWLKMKFLSEVLQSNLSEVKFLWFESDLSLYFTAEEVVDLIGLSFEKNATVRAAMREIRERHVGGKR